MNQRQIHSSRFFKTDDYWLGYYQAELEVNQRPILKSTRQKNWISNPGERKRVTFHSSVISEKTIKAEIESVTTSTRKIKTEKEEEVNMGKPRDNTDRSGLPANKRSGIQPFLFTQETFPDDHPTQSIETTENGSKIKTKMHVLEGDEAPELFMDWLTDYEDKIFANEVLRAPAKLSQLRRLVDGQAQTILSKVEKDYREVYSEPEDVELLTDYKIQEEVLAKYTTDNEVRTYFGDAGTAAVKTVRVEHIIRETIHRLKIQIFGNEKYGLQSFIQLKRTMTSIKIGNEMKIQQWSKRINQFQEYLPRCLWIAGAKKGLWPEAFDEERLKEILEFALAKEYLTELNKEGWCFQENTYDQSIHRIREIEPDILLRKREAKTKKEESIAIKELQDKAGLTTTKAKARESRGNRRDKSKAKGDGPKDANGYYKCGNCDKTHKGVCFKPLKGASGNAPSTPRAWSTKDTKNYIKQMIASDSKKNRKGKKKRRYSSDSSDSESSSDESWRRGMTGAEQMHMLASARIDPNDSDIEFTSEDEKRYRKQAKKWSKSKKRARR